MESSLGHVTTSLENFLECKHTELMDSLQIIYFVNNAWVFNVLVTESLPDDMQRNMTQMRELDRHYQGNENYHQVTYKHSHAILPSADGVLYDLFCGFVYCNILYYFSYINYHYYAFLDRLKEIEKLIHSYRREKDSALKRKYLIQIQRRLVKSQEYGDEKLQLVGHMMDLVSTIHCNMSLVFL